MGDWSRFIQDTNDQYGVDMRVLNDPYREEQRKYFLQVSSLQFFGLCTLSIYDLGVWEFIQHPLDSGLGW